MITICMQVLCFAVVAAISCSNALAQSTVKTRVTGTADWNNASTWIQLRTGNIAFTVGSTTVTGTGTSFLTQLQVGDQLVMDASPGTIRGTVSSINSNTSLTLTVAATASVSSAAYGRLAIPASVDNVQIGNTALSSGVNVTLNISDTVGSLTFVADNVGNSLTESSPGSLTVTGTATLNQPTSNSITNTWNINDGTATVGGLISFAGTASQSSRVFKVVLTTGTLNANGGMTFASSTNASKVLDLSGGACTVNLMGSLTINSGTLSSGSSSTFNWADNTNAQTINFFPTGAYRNVCFNNTSAGGATLSAAITSSNVAGDIFIQSGTLSNGGFAIGLATGDTFRVSSGALFKMTGTTGMATGTSILKVFDAGSTVEYAGTTQTVSAETYGSLTISTTGTKTAAGSCTIQNDFTLSNGTFAAGSYTHYLGGNWSMSSGTFSTTGTVTLNGTTAQNVTTTDDFYNLTINKSSGATTLLSDITVSHVLTFTSGILSAGSYTVIIPSGGSVSGAGQSTGWVNGKLQKYISTTTGSFDVGGAQYYAPVSYVMTGLSTQGGLTMSATEAYHPNIGSSNISAARNIKRYWSVTTPASGYVVVSSAAFTFNWNAADNYTPQTTSIMKVGLRDPGTGTWTYPTLSGTTTTTSITGTSSVFVGDFTVGETCDATFSYTGSPYCAATGTAAITLGTGALAGTFTASPSGLTLNATTGNITLSSSTSGTYTVTNTLSGSCAVATTSFTLNTVLATGVSTSTCVGGSTGTITASATGGTSPYTYNINSGAYSSSATFTGLAAGTYIIGAKSNVGCTDTETVVVSPYSTSTDNQTSAGTDSWIGHVYDGTAFSGYYGHYTEAETFNQSFGGNTNCFSITSGASTNSIYTETFSVKYRMNSTKRGLYAVNLGSDDGSRLTVDGTMVYNNWSDQAFSTKSNVLMSLTGSSSLLYEFYENGGSNQVIFQSLTKILANTLSANTTQSICMGNAGSAISGDTLSTLPSGITKSGTGYQWTYSTTPGGARTNITGATGTTFTPSTSTAPFNTAGTYYVYRNVVLSSANNISPNPYVATNESNAATITINAAPSATISYAGSPYCSNGGTASVTQTGTSGGTYSSTAGLSINSSTGAITLASSTAGTYTVTYTVAASGGCSLYTTTTSVTITAAPSATISYSGSPYCTNSGTATVTRTGTSGGTYSSTAGLSINSSTGAITLASSTAGTYTVTYTVAAANGCSQYTTTTSVTVTAAPSATISYSGTPYCTSGGTATVTRTGTAGGTYSSTAGLSINSSTGTITLGSSTAGTYTVTYTVAASGGCSVYNTTTSVTILSPGVWTGAVSTSWSTSGNWSCGGAPTSATNVTIPSGLTNYPSITSGTGSVNNLTIQSGASVTVNGGTLQIAGTVSNSGTFTATNGTVELNGSSAQTIPASVFATNTVANLTTNNSAGVSLSGTLSITGILKAATGTFATNGYVTLVSNASGTALIDGSGAGSITGNVTMQRYLSSGFGYRYISSPFQSSKVSQLSNDLNLNASFPTVYRYDESLTSAGWVSYTDTNGVLNPMQGYAANFGSSSSAKTVDISGVVNNGNVSSTLYNHNNTYSLGFNLVGNPYPSPIDWNAASGWTKTNIDNSIYYFNTGSTDQYQGSYSTYINGVSSDGVASNIIPSMQGFFVHVTSTAPLTTTGTLAINNNARVTNLTPVYHKQSSASPYPFVRISAGYESSPEFSDPTVVYFADMATDAYEQDMDAVKMLNTDERVPSFYSICTSERLAISALPQPDETTKAIPLGLKLEKDGSVVFKACDVTDIPAGLHVYFADAAKGIIQDMELTPTYSIPLNKGVYDNRFYLLFSRRDKVDIPTLDELFAYTSGHSIFVTVTTDKTDLTICNALGQVIKHQELSGIGLHEIPIESASGVYIVHANANGKQLYKKLFFGN
jgi:hypothetical protein